MTGTRRRHPLGRTARAGCVLAAVLAVWAGALVAGPRTSAVAHGGRSAVAPAVVPSSHLIVASAADPATGGYWLAATDGGVFAFGAPFEGSTGDLVLNSPVVGMAPTADGLGYWLVAADGGVFAFGDAAFTGSMGGRPLNAPVVGMAPTPDGLGYWLVAGDGGIFAFGDAAFTGSMGGRPLNAPVVAIAPSPDGLGYWLVAADGGIFAFGDAAFHGSTGNLVLHARVVGMAPDATTGGYRLVAADGGIFAFGAPFAGSAVGLLHRAAVSIDAAGDGYRVVSADGSVYDFGGAAYLGSVTVPPLVGEVVAVDPGHNGGNGSDPAAINQLIDGGGVIEPCDTAGTVDVNGYPEHAFNFDVATRLAAILSAGGATVVLTRTTDTGVGPCVDVRAAIGNLAGANAAVSIHGDGAPPSGSGFAVDVPVPVVSPISDDTGIVAPSAVLGNDVRDWFGADTGQHVSDYAGTDGIVPRGDLGGLDLSTVPKILIECGNMQNGSDAALMERPGWRQQAARGLADGITAFLVAQEVP